MNLFKKIINRFDGTSKSGIKNVIIKPISLLLSIIYTPLLLNYLGDEKYGVWATILTIINWVNYFDIGIGNGLRNNLSKDFAKDDNESAKENISTAYFMISIISTIIFIIFVLLINFIDMNKLLSTNIYIDTCLIISISFICVNFILSLINNILYAKMKPEFVSLRGCTTQTINIIGIILLNVFAEPNLNYVAILFGLSTTITYVFMSIVVYSKEKDFIPKFNNIKKSKVRGISGIGISFFIIQISCVIMFTVDNLLVSHYFGPTSVTVFSITNTVFNTAYSIFAAFLVPYWSKSCEAFENKDIVWIKSTIKDNFKISGIFILLYALIILIFNFAVSIWLQKDFYVSYDLLITMFIFYSLYSMLAVECQYINGSGKIIVQMIIYIFVAILNIPLSIYFSNNLGMGIVGIRLATTLLLLIEVIVLAFNLKKIVKNIEDEKNE